MPQMTLTGHYAQKVITQKDYTQTNLKILLYKVYFELHNKKIVIRENIGHTKPEKKILKLNILNIAIFTNLVDIAKTKIQWP